MELLAPWHLVILAFALIALFGYKRLPEMSRSVARSLRIFKTEMKGMTEDDAAREAHQAASTPAPVVPVTQVPVTQVPVTQVPIAPVVPVPQVPVAQVPVDAPHSANPPVTAPAVDATSKPVD
jgi:sec-independent protein translocase protein TatA